MEQLPQERLQIGVTAAAHAEAMFELTRDWVIQRKVFGGRVADLQTVKHKLAEIKVDVLEFTVIIGRSLNGFYKYPHVQTSITVCRAFIDQCMSLHDQGRLGAEMASMAKYWASDLENKVAADCLQLHGGWGFMWETQIAKSYAGCRVQTIYGGTNEIMKELIARNIVPPRSKK